MSEAGLIGTASPSDLAERRAKRRDIQRRYRARHHERIGAESRQRVKEWRALNPERARDNSRQYQLENAAAIRERKRRYYQEVRKHRDKTPEGRFKDRNRKARRRAAVVGDAVTAAEWAAILAAHDGRCAYCGCHPRVPEMDHVIPLARGGRHLASNIVPACKPCNSAKGAR